MHFLGALELFSSITTSLLKSLKGPQSVSNSRVRHEQVRSFIGVVVLDEAEESIGLAMTGKSSPVLVHMLERRSTPIFGPPPAFGFQVSGLRRTIQAG